jgi:hypothetical protein
MITGWLSTFLLTVAVELAVASPLLGIIEPSWRMRVRLVLLANLLSHPLVYFGVMAFTSPGAYLAAALVLELLASAGEALFYARAFGRRPLLPAVFISFFANAASLIASILVARWG